MHTSRFVCSLFILSACLDFPSAPAQEFRSPEVHSDGRVTFRLRSAKAESVRLSMGAITMDLRRTKKDIWAGTSSPLAPGIHDYAFYVDGTRMTDPANRFVKKWFTLASLVEVPGRTPLLTELQDVPHGAVQRLLYKSSSVGPSRPVIIYTPPGYENGGETYPFLLLMHGFGDDETAWTEVGRTHLIADNLIAQGKIRPCVIAMPYGHPIPPPYGRREDRPKDYFVNNANLYEKDIATDLLPFLKSRFRISSDRSERAVAGLSMGGGHATYIGLRHVDSFSHVGAFSAAAPQPAKEDLAGSLPSIFGENPKANQLTSFWLPIGRDDFLLKRNRVFSELLKMQGVKHELDITEGNHSWKVWRKYLPEFLERSFPVK